MTDEMTMQMPVMPAYGAGNQNGFGFGGDWAWILLLLVLFGDGKVSVIACICVACLPLPLWGRVSVGSLLPVFSVSPPAPLGKGVGGMGP